MVRGLRLLSILSLAVALSLAVFPGTAMADHNSVGEQWHVMQPDEVDVDGILQPDIPEGSPYADIAFHEDVSELIPGRAQPTDQTGLHYNGASCKGPDDVSNYEERLPNTTGDGETREDACYVGFIDGQLEYEMIGSIALVTECQCDDLYAVNPAPSDDYCNGREDQQNAGTVSVSNPLDDREDLVTVEVADTPDNVDQLGTSADRRTEGDCSGSDHQWFLPFGGVLVDTDLIEPAAAGNAAGTDLGSGTVTLPYPGNPYVYIFGQPHPGVDHDGDGDPLKTDGDDLSGSFEAGEGPFGETPPFGSPVTALTENACKGRTQECVLLTPADIKAYDPLPAGATTGNQARACLFSPQFSYSVIGDDGDIDRDRGACGNTGQVLDDFVASTGQGGLGQDGVPPTWVNNLPGWYWGVLHLTEQTTATQTFATDYLDDEQGFNEPWLQYYAVNPIGPTIDGSLNCVQPNILTDSTTFGVDLNEDGDTDDAGETFTDSGYMTEDATYLVDAIDVDVHPSILRGPQEGVNDATHDQVRAVANDVNSVISVAGDTVDETVPEDSPADPVVDAVNEQLDAISEETAELQDRAEYLESSDPEPHAQNGTQNQFPTTKTVERGLSCNAAGQVVFKEEDTDRFGGLRFNAGVTRNTVSIKDPTLIDQGLPAEESETGESAWQTDVYNFGGQAHSVLDFNDNDEFDSCPGANIDAGDDLCPWEALWDAYNSQCQGNQGAECGTTLEDQYGYDTDQGVGLYFVLRTTGPTVVMPEPGTTDDALIQENTLVFGTQGDATAQNCIVGVSKGFGDKLAHLLISDTSKGDGVAPIDANDLDDILCPDTPDVNRGVITDAFDDQSAVTPGGFSSNTAWAKLAPTPAGANDAVGGASDQLCVNGVWSVDPSVGNGIANDTEGAGNLNLDSTGDWDLFTDGVQTSPADLNAWRFTDCDVLGSPNSPDEA